MIQTPFKMFISTFNHYSHYGDSLSFTAIYTFLHSVSLSIFHSHTHCDCTIPTEENSVHCRYKRIHCFACGALQLHRLKVDIWSNVSCKYVKVTRNNNIWLVQKKKLLSLNKISIFNWTQIGEEFHKLSQFKEDRTIVR